MWDKHDMNELRNNMHEVVLDWLSVWLDPEKSDFVAQSYVPETAELTQFLMNFTPFSELTSNPTLKNELKQVEWQGTSITAWFATYPISQAADILLPKCHIVPVWDDQLPHIELARKIAKIMNRQCGSDIFPLPKAFIGKIGRLTGIDWKAKASKTLGNAIELSETPDNLRKKVNKMYTDPGRIRATDPGKIEWNVVFAYLDAFLYDENKLNEYKSRYEAGTVSDREMKEVLFEVLNAFLEPIREKRALYAQDKAYVSRIIQEWSNRAREIAQKTMQEVKDGLGISNY